ncbi:uncharacterized protein LOC118646626 [Monomorium pharaonis]|uniref:uncharacterized protein LOC118646626 n=1 Tax=Monomorium pharaonis TaxID=307658 RepID=UPI0017466811|nr:uncharacterized protein LOC118646626 [Monomorium pharaonis]
MHTRTRTRVHTPIEFWILPRLSAYTCKNCRREPRAYERMSAIMPARCCPGDRPSGSDSVAPAMLPNSVQRTHNSSVYKITLLDCCQLRRATAHNPSGKSIGASEVA